MKNSIMLAMALMTAFASYAQNKPASWINNVKLSGYGIVQYQSSSKVNDKSNSFNLRLARVSLDGRILDDFYWKAQIQFNGNTTDLGNSPRVVDLLRSGRNMVISRSRQDSLSVHSLLRIPCTQ